MPIGVFPLALAADRFGAANAITGACAVLFVLIVLFFLISSTFRDLDETVQQKLESTASDRPDEQPMSGLEPVNDDVRLSHVSSPTGTD